MIEIRQLRKEFGSFVAVDGITFTVKPGEVLGFLGPNGAGKSTTMKMVTGFLAPSAGTAVVCGHDIQTHAIAAKKCIGYLPEGAPAYPDMTPTSYLRFIAEIRGFDGADRRKRVDAAAERIGLRGVMEQPIETLSKGYKRRVGLAQALLHDPQVLVLDEPTDGLDPNQKHEVRKLIKSLGSDKTVILSTHILEEVESVCTRAVIIARGRMIADETPETLRTRATNHNAVHVRLRSAPDGIDRDLRKLAGVQSVLKASTEGLAWVVRPVDGKSIVGAVSESLRSRGAEIQELRVELGRLDDVFRDLTSNARKAASREEAA